MSCVYLVGADVLTCFDFAWSICGYLSFGNKHCKKCLNISDADFSNAYKIDRKHLAFEVWGGQNKKNVIPGECIPWTADKNKWSIRPYQLTLHLSIIVHQEWASLRCQQLESCEVRWKEDRGRRQCWPWTLSHMWLFQRWQHNHVDPQPVIHQSSMKQLRAWQCFSSSAANKAASVCWYL